MHTLNFHHGDEVALHETIFPGFRFALRKAHFSLLMSAIGIATYIMSYGLEGLLHIPRLSFSNLHYPEFLVLRLHIFFCILEIGYWELYRRNFRLMLDGKRLIVRKGVFRIAECSFPLSHGTEVYLVRSLRDILLGIWSVHIPTPGQGDAGQPKSSKFDGLTYEQALSLRKIVTNVISDRSTFADVQKKVSAATPAITTQSLEQANGFLVLPYPHIERFLSPLPQPATAVPRIDYLNDQNVVEVDTRERKTKENVTTTTP